MSDTDRLPCEAASPVVGCAVDAPIPEVSVSCLLILLRLAILADM